MTAYIHIDVEYTAFEATIHRAPEVVIDTTTGFVLVDVIRRESQTREVPATGQAARLVVPDPP